MAADVVQSIAINAADGSYQRAAQVRHFSCANGHAGATATVGYVKSGTDTPKVTLAQNATADTFVVPLLDLHVGDIITEIGIHGQADSAGNAFTVDYALRALTAVITGCTDALIQAGTQIGASTDTLINHATAVATPHKVIEGECPYILITCTTGGVTDIELLNIHIKVNQR